MFTRMTRRHAFTLVEMSIVLSIIALLIGVVVGGVALLKQSEVQTVLADFAKYNAAVNNFQVQYGGLPGDLIDATSYWGDTASCDDSNDAGTPGTCNGSSNGRISAGDGDGNEPYRAWQHLMLSRLVDGNFSGVASGGGAAPGVNVPKSRVQGAGWTFDYRSTAADANNYAQVLANYLAFGAAISGAITQGAAITPTEAWQIDGKADDGKPGTGRIVSMKDGSAQAPNCASSATAYNVQFNNTACGLNMSLTLK